MDYKQRTVTSHELETYSFVNYVSYALYPPLFIAGPIMTFNDFMWQVSYTFHVFITTLTLDNST